MTKQPRLNPKKKKLQRPFSPKRMDEFIEATMRSNIPQATRRIFFTYTEAPVEERGFYIADMLAGMGTGILFRFNSKYFLLTAYHVVVETLRVQQNESPFFVQARSTPAENVFAWYEMLRPRWHWDIRTLMPESPGDVSWKDVALIELFDPMCAIPDNEVIDMDNVQVLRRREFFNGQMLIGSGYPTQRNDYEFGDLDEFGPGLAQRTKIQRHHSQGSAVEGTNGREFHFKPADPEANHASLNGMSGGTVVNIYPRAKKTKWVGMLKAVDQNTGLLHFIPADVIMPVIRRYAESKRLDLDPNADKPFVGITPKKRKEVQQLMKYAASLR
jgi:hypothetical protein